MYFDPVKAKLAAKRHDRDPELAAMAAIGGKLSIPPGKPKPATLDDQLPSPEALDAAIAALDELSDEQRESLANTASLFPDDFEESELGLSPSGWETTRIAEIAKIIKGKSYKSSELSSSNTALVTLKSFNRGGGYRLDGLKEYSGKYKPEQEVFAGDLIIAYTDVTQAADVIGKPAMVISDSRYGHLVISLDVAVVRPENDSLKYFLYGLANTDEFQDHTSSYTSGTTVLHLSKLAVPEYQFSKPPDELIENYKKNVAPMFSLINENIEESRTLEQTRDTLLPKLLSGEIRVPVEEQEAVSA